MIDLKDLNIVLTGATGIIGNSILDKLISTGANVLATGTNEEKLKKLYELLTLKKLINLIFNFNLNIYFYKI